MAKGNWKPNVIKPKTRCHLCGYVIKSDKVYLNGITPAHRYCAEAKSRDFSETFQPKVTQ